MKRVDLIKTIEGFGCILVRHGGKHDWYRIAWTQELENRNTQSYHQSLRRESFEESLLMSSAVITTVVKMMESLPDPVQDRVAEHLREYIEDLRDELQWDETFKKTQSQLVTAARRAKQEIAAGQAKPLDPDQL